jgi:hypothetical protein
LEDEWKKIVKELLKIEEWWKDLFCLRREVMSGGGWVFWLSKKNNERVYRE